MGLDPPDDDAQILDAGDLQNLNGGTDSAFRSRPTSLVTDLCGVFEPGDGARSLKNRP
jgi:hypothetical protein